MLIDFSDVLQTNVYVLAHTFVKFCEALSINLPTIDPSLYIQRFASKLEFEEKTNLVANTALRILQRMNRDWLVIGRRPSGICGACLLIAARLHGFRRSQKEVINVVRICDGTLRKRLIEFKQTPSGSMTGEEFELIDVSLFREQDPPSFNRKRKVEEIDEKIQIKIDTESELNNTIEEMEKNKSQELIINEREPLPIEKEIEEPLPNEKEAEESIPLEESIPIELETLPVEKEVESLQEDKEVDEQELTFEMESALKSIEKDSDINVTNVKLMNMDDEENQNSTNTSIDQNSESNNTTATSNNTSISTNTTISTVESNSSTDITPKIPSNRLFPKKKKKKKIFYYLF